MFQHFVPELSPRSSPSAAMENSSIVKEVTEENPVSTPSAFLSDPTYSYSIFKEFQQNQGLQYIHIRNGNQTLFDDIDGVVSPHLYERDRFRGTDYASHPHHYLHLTRIIALYLISDPYSVCLLAFSFSRQ